MILFQADRWTCRESSGWIIAPVAEMNGQVGLTVTHVRVGNQESETKVYIWPTDRNDPAGLEIKESGKKRRLQNERTK